MQAILAAGGVENLARQDVTRLELGAESTATARAMRRQ